MINFNQLTFDGHRFAYRTCGSGPDVLLIHGWLSSGRMWENLMAYLAGQYRLWAIDLIGFGDSRTDDPTLELSVDQQTRLVVAFCERIGIRPHAVIGHSMGGTITLKLALDHADLLDKIALVCPVVTGNLHFNLNRVLALQPARKILSMGRHLWPHLRNFPGAQFFVAPSYLRREAINRSCEDFRKATWNATYSGLLSLLNIRLDRRLHEIAKPAFVVTGSHDATVPPSDARLAARTIRGARLLEFPTCHHQPPDEEPERFHEALGQFLNAAKVIRPPSLPRDSLTSLA